MIQIFLFMLQYLIRLNAKGNVFLFLKIGVKNSYDLFKLLKGNVF